MPRRLRDPRAAVSVQKSKHCNSSHWLCSRVYLSTISCSLCRAVDTGPRGGGRHPPAAPIKYICTSVGTRFRFEIDKRQINELKSQMSKIIRDDTSDNTACRSVQSLDLISGARQFHRVLLSRAAMNIISFICRTNNNRCRVDWKKIINEAVNLTYLKLTFEPNA